ncbi:tumor necrosis factor ligand superfamily member 11 [Hyperolius riggenbachi]|uniref:tumor necrosis factor ligand superfamily member 11 n=1 Tax=Hyperolius riggenbachi TaxID=752182 RepID=UPI0035A2D32F
MSPGGYLRGAAELEGPPEIAKQSHTYPKSIYLAVIFLALLQVGCTMGLFLYIKQMDPSRINEELQCWRNILKEDKEISNSCEETKQAFNAAVLKAQELRSRKQSRIGDGEGETPNHTRVKNSHEWPVAHLTFNATGNLLGNKSALPIHFWKHNEGLAHLEHMEYSNGRLKILQDGYYFVYTNICFRHYVLSSNLTTNESQLMLYVKKSKKTKKVTLMKGGKTAAWSNNTYNFYSAYLGGVFKLMAGEEIYIKATHIDLMDPDQEATYFGAFKLVDIQL